jgi:hypothetical protein
VIGKRHLIIFSYKLIVTKLSDPDHIHVSCVKENSSFQSWNVKKPNIVAQDKRAAFHKCREKQ